MAIAFPNGRGLFYQDHVPCHIAKMCDKEILFNLFNYARYAEQTSLVHGGPTALHKS